MNGYLTTHVLDTARGRPASGIGVALFRVDARERDPIASARTNADGRTDAPILPQERFETGAYELVFAVGAYLDRVGRDGPVFLTDVPIRFAMTEPVHYHVPLLLSPYGYATYRGS